jgi:hypothetical protein
MEDDTKYEAALEAITELFNDTSCDAATTLINLNSLIEEIQTMKDSLSRSCASED